MLSAQSNMSSISGMSNLNNVRVPGGGKGRKSPLFDATTIILVRNQIRNAEDRRIYESNARNIKIIDQIKEAYPAQWNATADTEREIRKKVSLLITQRLAKYKAQDLIREISEQVNNATEQASETPVSDIQEEVYEIPIRVAEEDATLPVVAEEHATLPVVAEEHATLPVVNHPVVVDRTPDVVSMKQHLEDVSEGLITRMEYAVENISSRTFADIDSKTQELNEQMAASYRELTGELKETIRTYKKKISKMMEAKIAELEGANATIHHIVEVPEPARIGVKHFVSPIIVFATICYYMFV
jgi:hypothetical protein